MYGKQNIQEQKILYVCFEVNRKNIFNLSFCVVIVNVPKNDLCFDEMAEMDEITVSNSFIGKRTSQSNRLDYVPVTRIVIYIIYLNLV